MRNARLSLLWYLVARGKQQENRHGQIGSARVSPLALNPLDGQPWAAAFLTSQKMAKYAKCACFVAMALGRAWQAAGETLTSKSGLSELAPLLSARLTVSPVASLCHASAVTRKRCHTLYIDTYIYIYRDEVTKDL